MVSNSKSTRWQITLVGGGSMTVASIAPISRDEAVKRAQSTTRCEVLLAAPVFDRKRNA